MTAGKEATNDPGRLTERLIAGDPNAAARCLTLVENGGPAAAELMEAVHAHKSSAQAYRIGITGPPGAGKSTLVGALAELLRAKGLTLAVLAVDPTSPFSGGALLGDRVRMRGCSGDPGVFIRSMATRGAAGGLCEAAEEACEVLRAFGRDYIVIETVGAGQLEIDVMNLCDTTVVVLNPESGDNVQMMKAGLMEIGDIFAINKADRPGADRLEEHLTTGLEIKRDWRKENKWEPPVVQTEAIHGTGIDLLLDKIEGHFQFLTKNGLLQPKRRKRLASRVERMVEARMRTRVWGEDGRKILDKMVKKIEAGTESPDSAARKIVAEALGGERL